MQTLIDRKFGPGGEDLVGRSLSAASFAPSLPSATSGNVGFIQRKAIDARLSRSRQELSEAGFLKIDDADGSELWRISLRVAAFRDVDYGQFVKELEEITQPLLDAYHTRSDVFKELTRLAGEKSPAGKTCTVVEPLRAGAIREIDPRDISARFASTAGRVSLRCPTGDGRSQHYAAY